MEVYLGTTESGGNTVSIDEKDRRKHMAIFGKSGVGKTTLMRNMIVADLHDGNGLTVVDPQGAEKNSPVPLDQPVPADH